MRGRTAERRKTFCRRRNLTTGRRACRKKELWTRRNHRYRRRTFRQRRIQARFYRTAFGQSSPGDPHEKRGQLPNRNRPQRTRQNRRYCHQAKIRGIRLRDDRPRYSERFSGRFLALGKIGRSDLCSGPRADARTRRGSASAHGPEAGPCRNLQTFFDKGLFDGPAQRQI